MKLNKITPLALAAALAFAASAPVMAADAPAAPKGPTISDILSNSGVSVQGYMDASYIAHNHIPNANVQVFDVRQNSLEVHQAGITVSNNTVTAKDGSTSPTPGFSALLNLTVGTDSSVFGSYPYVSGNTLFDLTQGYAQYSKGPLTVIAGKFTTLAGAEVIDSSNAADANITRSILFGKVPFTHTGVRATYAVSDSTNFIAGVNNGWDQVAATGSNKTAELGFNTAISKDTSLAVSGYSGTTNVGSSYAAMATSTSTHVGNRSLIDAVFSTNLTPNLTLILEALASQQENLTYGSGLITESYHGFAGYLNYKWSDPLHTSLRFERFIDSKGGLVSSGGGVVVGSTGISELTLTAGYTLSDHFEVRGEVRGERADTKIYPASNGAPYQTLTTVGVQGLYRF